MLPAKVVPAERFSRRNGQWSAFRSDLGCFGGVFNDAIDEGYYVWSAASSKLAPFAVEETHRDQDNDVTHWVLKPVQRSNSLLRDAGELAAWETYKHITLTIFNT